MPEELQNFRRHIWERYLSKANFGEKRKKHERLELTREGNCRAEGISELRLLFAKYMSSKEEIKGTNS